MCIKWKAGTSSSSLLYIPLSVRSQWGDNQLIQNSEIKKAMNCIACLHRVMNALIHQKGWLIKNFNQSTQWRVTNFTVAVHVSINGHGKAMKASLEKEMLELSLEWASQGFERQSTGVEGCCCSAVCAVQCKQSRFASLFSQLQLLSVRTLIQLGLITLIVSTEWSQHGNNNPNAISVSEKSRIYHEPL